VKKVLSITTIQPPCLSSAKTGSQKGLYAAVVLLLLIVYLGSAFSPGLMDDADATHAEAAREMLVRHDFVTLHVNGIRYLEKAPLMYWLVAFSYRFFGVSDIATRLPIVLAMLLLAVLAMRWGQLAFGERAGVYSGLFVSTAVGFFLFTRILIPDVILSLLIATSFYFFLTALNDKAAWRWYLAYACVALGVLTKGLVMLVFVGGTAAGYLLLSGEWRRWREFRLLGGTVLFLAIAAPWHLLAGFRNHGFFWFYFVNEHFLRFLGKRYPRDYNKLPASLYWSLHLVWLFPWSMYLPSAIADLRRNLRGQGTRAESLTFAFRTRLLCLIWAGIILVFFAISTNQEYYTLPAYFPILLLIAGTIAEAEEGAGSKWLSWSAGAVAALAMAAGAMLIAGLWSSRQLPYVADISTVLAKHDMAKDTLSMSHMLDLTGESFAALRLPAILAALALVVGPACALYLRLKRRHLLATWMTAGTMVVLLVAAHLALERFAPYMSSKPLAQIIARQARPEDKIFIYGEQSHGSSLLIYLQRPIYLVNGATTSMWFGSTFPDAPKIFLHDLDLVGEWGSSTRIFLFVTSCDQAHVEALIPGPKYVIAERSGKTVYSNRPGS
jgi:4-amino-4-deoxy-L-arabinose transferase-like glycosyltransferase